MKTRFRRPHRFAALGVLAAAGATAAHAQDAAAPNAAMRFLSAGAQADARHNQALQGTLSLPVGERGWVQLGGGQTRSEQDAVSHRPGVFTAGAGFIGTGWQAALNAAHRADGQAFRQTDGSLTLDWQAERFNLGLDGSLRDARQQGTVSAPDGQGGTATVPVVQTVRGGGLGLHGGVRLGANANVHAGFMRYHYQVLTQQNGASSGSGGLISGLLGNRTLLARALSTRESAVNRDEAALSRSVQIGATYRFEQVALTADYTGDHVLDTPGTVHTVLLKAALTLGPRWTLVPALGRTRSASFGGVNFGALSASVAW